MILYALKCILLLPIIPGLVWLTHHFMQNQPHDRGALMYTLLTLLVMIGPIVTSLREHPWKL